MPSVTCILQVNCVLKAIECGMQDVPKQIILTLLINQFRSLLINSNLIFHNKSVSCEIDVKIYVQLGD